MVLLEKLAVAQLVGISPFIYETSKYSDWPCPHEPATGD
jgi:hypothetical protein